MTCSCRDSIDMDTIVIMKKKIIIATKKKENLIEWIKKGGNDA